MFSIIIPVLDPFDRLVRAGVMEELVRQVFLLEGKKEIIFINNNNLNVCPILTRYLRVLSASSMQVKVLEPGLNLGTARGFNAGIKIVSSEARFYIFMSTDADIVDFEMLTKIKSIMAAQPRIGIAHPMSVYEDINAFNISAKYSIKKFHKIIRSKTPPESVDITNKELANIILKVSNTKKIITPYSYTPLTFAIYRREMIEDIGSFDEGIEKGCYEVNDLGLRAYIAGYEIVRINNVFVNHRRYFIRNLVLAGTPEINKLPHSEAIKQSKEWWNKRWGKPHVEIYTELKYGRLIYTLMFPYFIARRLGGAVKALLRF